MVRHKRYLARRPLSFPPPLRHHLVSSRQCLMAINLRGEVRVQGVKRANPILSPLVSFFVRLKDTFSDFSPFLHQAKRKQSERETQKKDLKEIY